MKKYSVAVIGVGAVGIEMLRVLKQRNFPAGELRLFASEKSVGTKDAEASLEDTSFPVEAFGAGMKRESAYAGHIGGL